MGCKRKETHVNIIKTIDMEKVCVYQDANSIRESLNWIKTTANRLQELADDLTKTDIVPTIEKLQILFESKSLLDLVTESCNNQGISMITKRLQELMRKDTAKDIEKIKIKAANLIHTEVSPIEWDLYLVNNGKVSIKPEYKQIITDRHSIYIDTDTRAAVYEKWLAVEKAIKEFNQAVVEAPKVSAVYENLVRLGNPSAEIYNPKYMIGISTPNQFSLARLDPDGTPVLKGENFKSIK